MPFKVRPVYASAAPGKKPTKFIVEDIHGVKDSEHLYKADAEKRKNELNRKHKPKFV